MGYSNERNNVWNKKKSGGLEIIIVMLHIYLTEWQYSQDFRTWTESKEAILITSEF